MTKSPFLLRGEFLVEIHDKAGKLKHRFVAPNGIVNGGKNHALDAVFDGGGQIANWYIGIINNSPVPTLNAADTMLSHAGWVEFTTYSEGTRVEWAPDAAASQQIANSVVRTFTISTAGTVYGLFITSDSTKSGTAGTLWSTAAFDSTLTLAISDTIKVTYTITS